ncbi:serine O-acetyltransferase [Mariniphaga anaerophila]|uniref:Serine acetyltransferase n=1 Tax=Mariniphaga anaerophila TaxID=1484053 RepID=A0A1M4VL71_9BACT|nr:hypothetical protein [Mariniphaga anaerophila]SHE69744.1 serine O-acetyltransferase [Mariniphaga anaerophila]
MTMLKSIQNDLTRHIGQNRSFTKYLKAYFSIPGFRYMFWFRTTKTFAKKKKHLPLFVYCRLRLRHYSYKYGIDITYSTEIGEGFYIGHFSTIIISPRAIIRKNVNISQGVTIGMASRGSKKGAAIIGESVYIGPGAKIVGKVVIGNNVAIGANAVVTKDIPDNAVAVGIPAKIISYKGSSGYILNKV